MRNMSFRLTSAQVLDRSKSVTRRVGWKFLKAGDLLQAVAQNQGLKKGAHVTKLAVLRVDHVSHEWMSDFVHRPDAQDECRREGFPELTPREFTTLFRHAHGHPGADDLRVTRIAFSYVDEGRFAAVQNGAVGQTPDGSE